MVRDFKMLMTMLCCLGVITMVPACKKKKDKQTTHVRKETIKRGPGVRQIKTSEKVDASANY